MAAQGLDRTLAALADPVRRQVVDLLREKPRRAGELAALTGLSPPAMSRHLKLLRRTGIVDEARDEADSRVRLYRLEAEGLIGLDQWLANLRGFWQERLDGFRRHAEAAVLRDDTETDAS
jgi:DNA-binding transcriptional ArsR family regulator